MRSVGAIYRHTKLLQYYWLYPPKWDLNQEGLSGPVLPHEKPSPVLALGIKNKCNDAFFPEIWCLEDCLPSKDRGKGRGGVWESRGHSGCSQDCPALSIGLCIHQSSLFSNSLMTVSTQLPSLIRSVIHLLSSCIQQILFTSVVYKPSIALDSGNRGKQERKGICPLVTYILVGGHWQ